MADSLVQSSQLLDSLVGERVEVTGYSGSLNVSDDSQIFLTQTWRLIIPQRTICGLSWRSSDIEKGEGLLKCISRASSGSMILSTSLL
jgi:hypothetical protein